MTELPEKFPEYSIMYKTLSRQIETLRHQLKSTNQEEADGIKLKIKRYESEIIKIKEMFPRDYFERKY
ncbi:hypothetical protein K0U27_00405 [archaeon]|nr:hypothetical protein [archaeon]